jgi:hypothetical protein
MNLQPAFVISLVVTVVGAVALCQPRQYAWVGDQTGYAPAQPIEFSHKIHAKDNGIPCEYCHSGARKGPVAEIPAASTCMNCHSEVAKNAPEVKKVAAALKTGRGIEWVRIHDLPHFTRFDHSAHVAAGVSCQTCHGPVETMARVEQTRHMSMGWCIECHRDPTRAKPALVQVTGSQAPDPAASPPPAAAAMAPAATTRAVAAVAAAPPPTAPDGGKAPPAHDPHAWLGSRKSRASTECSTCHY